MAEKEAVVGQVHDWQDGQMKQVTVGETDILVEACA
jgi:hypothetical protein